MNGIFKNLYIQGNNGCIKEPKEVIENPANYAEKKYYQILKECENCTKNKCNIILNTRK